jgi:hypothetical protein
MMRAFSWMICSVAGWLLAPAYGGPALLNLVDQKGFDDCGENVWVLHCSLF